MISSVELTDYVSQLKMSLPSGSEFVEAKRGSNASKRDRYVMREFMPHSMKHTHASTRTVGHNRLNIVRYSILP